MPNRCWGKAPRHHYDTLDILQCVEDNNKTTECTNFRKSVAIPILFACPVLHPCDRAVHPEGHLPGRRDEFYMRTAETIQCIMWIQVGLVVIIRIQTQSSRGRESFADHLTQHVVDEIAFNQEYGLTTQYDTPQTEAANRRVTQRQRGWIISLNKVVRASREKHMILMLVSNRHQNIYNFKEFQEKMES